MTELVMFWIMAVIAVPAALFLILSKNPIHSALWLVVNFFATAVFFLMLDAQFVAFVHLLIYAGAIMVLFLFVIMLLNLTGDIDLTEDPMKGQLWVAPILSVILLALTIVIVRAGVFQVPFEQFPPEPAFGQAYPVAEVLFTTYMFPFELTSVLLLVGMIGAVVLAKRRI